MNWQLPCLLSLCIGIAISVPPVDAQPTAKQDGASSNDTATGSPKKTGIKTSRAGARMLPPTKQEDVFHFVIYGDRTGGVPAGVRILEQAVRDTNLLDPDLVMTVGDLIQGYNRKPEWLRQMTEYKTAMGQLNMNWFPVAGNHDVYWRGDGPTPLGHHESNYEKHFGPLWYSFGHKNTGFIVLYSDEGDAATNRKGFGEGALQKMSDQQLAFLDKSLAEHKDADHVFVFLHHPRWIGGGYTGGNWDVVHERLKNAGNVSAVFAGHIHHMRYDPKDNIEYITLATTGGHLSAEIPQAGYLHHLNLVTVRPETISVSAIPVGSVFDPKQFTPEFLAEIDRARSIRPVQTSPEIVLQLDGSATGETSFLIKNPGDRPVEATLGFETTDQDNSWMAKLDHQHFVLSPKESKTIQFAVDRVFGNPAQAALPVVRMQLDYLGETARVKLPDVVTPINVTPGQVPIDYFSESPPQALHVTDDQATIQVNSDQFELPDGPVTLEAWIRPDDLTGYNAIIAKTQSSDYALFSDEGVPQFDIHLAGKYVTARAKDLLPTDRWTHVAGVFDGSQVKIFVDGKLINSVAGSGTRRTNKLPLYLGADPNGSGTPTRSFSGKIDEVRLSKSAVYADSFKPERRLAPTDDTVLMFHLDKNVGPFILDQSQSAASGILRSNAKLIPITLN